MIKVYICSLDHSINVAETEWREVRTYKKEFVIEVFSTTNGAMVYQGRKYSVDRNEFCKECKQFLGLKGGTL